MNNITLEDWELHHNQPSHLKIKLALQDQFLRLCEGWGETNILFVSPCRTQSTMPTPIDSIWRRRSGSLTGYLWVQNIQRVYYVDGARLIAELAEIAEESEVYDNFADVWDAVIACDLQKQAEPLKVSTDDNRAHYSLGL